MGGYVVDSAKTREQVVTIMPQRLAPVPAREEPEVADVFEVAMSRLAAGVAMVTCHVDDKPWGLTVSACCSVSSGPAAAAWSRCAPTRSARDDHQTSGRFGVSLLGESLSVWRSSEPLAGRPSSSKSSAGTR